jgi:hypothetical protein
MLADAFRLISAGPDLPKRIHALDRLSPHSVITDGHMPDLCYTLRRYVWERVWHSFKVNQHLLQALCSPSFRFKEIVDFYDGRDGVGGKD